MKRLTFDGLFCDLAVCQEHPCKYPKTGCSQRQVWERLKQIEDILGYTYDLDVLKGLVGAVNVETNIYDKVETIEGCTVKILTNTITGDTSVGWWKGSAEDMAGRDERHDHH